MNTQDIHEIGGFEDGKGEKLDIKKNSQDQQRNSVHSKNYDFNSTGNLSTKIKVFGYFSLLCLFVFLGLSIGIDYKFSVGAAACFAMFIFCIFESSAVDKRQTNDMFYKQRESDDNIKNGNYKQNNVEQDCVDDDLKNKKEVQELAKENQFHGNTAFKAELNNFTEYDKNNYDSSKKNNVVKF